MLTFLQSYFFAFKLGMQKALAYRINFVFRSLFNLLPLFAIICLWRAIYKDAEQMISGYTIMQMISYYLMVSLVDSLTSVTEDDWQIASEIKDGHISQFLVRPLDYLAYRLSLFTAGRCVYTVAAIAPTLGFLFYRQYIVWPADISSMLYCGVAIVLSALLQFLLSFILAMLAFWVLEISAFAFVLLAFQRLLGGQMFPLDILPGWLQTGLLCTPFPYTAYFPVSIYLGRLDASALVSGMLIQAGWVGLLYIAARYIWHQGLQRFTAAGV